MRRPVAPRHRAARSSAAAAPPLLVTGVLLGMVAGLLLGVATPSPPAAAEGDADSGALAEPIAAPPAADAPSAPPSPAPAAPTTGPPLTLAFAGDVMFEGAVGARLAAVGDDLLDPIDGVLGAADLTVVNLETAITDRADAAPKQFTFRGPPSGLSALRAAGVDVVSLANNHGMDFGQAGLADTLAAAATAGLPVVGAGTDRAAAYAPFTTTIRGRTVAVLGATQVLDRAFLSSWVADDGRPGLASAKEPHVDRLVAAVAAARVAADTVVVVLHWGVERHTCPSPAQQALAERLVAAGADVVVGGHAHRLQGAGSLDGAYVAYGLGNFVFSSAHGPGADSGVLTVTVDGDEVLGAAWTPARVQGGIPHPLSGAAADEARAAFEGLRGCTGLS